MRNQTDFTFKHTLHFTLFEEWITSLFQEPPKKGSFFVGTESLQYIVTIVEISLYKIMNPYHDNLEIAVLD